MLLAGLIFCGFMVQANAQEVFIPDLNAGYRIKIATGDKAGYSMTYKGYSAGNGIAPVFETTNNSDLNQIFRFVLVNGIAEADGNPEYFIESAVDLSESALTDRGAFSNGRSESWHTLRVYQDTDNKYALRSVGSGSVGQRFTLYLNSDRFGYRDNNADAIYKNNPPTEDYSFVIEKVPLDDIKSMFNFGHAQAVVDEVNKQESQNITVFGANGRYRERDTFVSLETALTNSLNTFATAQSVGELYPVYENLTVFMNALFADATLPVGDFYMRNNNNNAFFSRINNNKATTLRFYGYNSTDPNDQTYTFSLSADNSSVQVKYKDANNGGTDLYLKKNGVGTTVPNEAEDNLVFCYDISSGNYAAQFVNDNGFLYTKNGTNGETANSGSNTLKPEYLFISIIPETATPDLVELQSAITNANATYQTVIDDEFTYYNTQASTDFGRISTESSDLIKYKFDASSESISAQKAKLEAALKAYTYSREFAFDSEVQLAVPAVNFVGVEKNTSTNGFGIRLEASGNYGYAADGCILIVGSVDFTDITLQEITIETANQSSGSGQYDVYIDNPYDK